MTPEAQRIAIAEQLPDLVIIAQRKPIPILLWKNRSYNVDFDPLSDLNAMHEAEKVLTASQHYDYTGRLSMLIDGFRATAAQRAETFLRTLNLWKD